LERAGYLKLPNGLTCQSHDYKLAPTLFAALEVSTGNHRDAFKRRRVEFSTS